MPHERTANEIAHARAVRDMFSGIARRYDLLNHVLSVNIDKRWRRIVREKLAGVLSNPDATVLDVACGTGDLSIELKQHARARIVGSDFCRPMLAIARRKATDGSLAIPFVEGDALALPFADAAFDAVTIAFGLRNLASWEDGLLELNRILKPGGKLAVLEFSSPSVPGFRTLFNLYFSQILPRIGGLVSGSRSAYEYLPSSVSEFPDQKGLAELMGRTGFGDVEYTNLTGGIAAIHVGIAKERLFAQARA
ncbi:MAG TPA: bifunctional demethylmenaquinone methyltransferase/2-methoxy-6-polyprenyl-1,4-benzoquinol methylase UbiE [Pyrinomonadaceae bacterium]|nr:bifunctional demethylmenaquinone methyltransferase/2-methoxy-6-polyprenyl-1,4-benzoquinol methylase UbiE [Pyrinomonadaceae bacterium]